MIIRCNLCVPDDQNKAGKLVFILRIIGCKVLHLFGDEDQPGDRFLSLDKI